MAQIKTTKLNERILQKIKSHSWIQDESLGYEIGLHRADNPYQVFEGVLVNVSSSIGKSWLEVYNARDHQTELYSNLCVCAILIDRWLEIRFKFNEEGRIHLLGARLSQIVYKYKYSLGYYD